jgi:hypothetical protein
MTEIEICELCEMGYSVMRDETKIFISEKHLKLFFDKISKGGSMPASKKKAPAKKKAAKK